MTPTFRQPHSWSDSPAIGACLFTAEPSSGLFGRPREKKTSHANDGEMAPAGVRALTDPKRFWAAGGHLQAEYERRRLAFLAATTQADDTGPPVGLGPQGLAGLLLAGGGVWTVCVVAAAPRRWTGAVDSRLTALLEAYRVIRRSTDHSRDIPAC